MKIYIIKPLPLKPQSVPVASDKYSLDNIVDNIVDDVIDIDIGVINRVLDHFTKKHCCSEREQELLKTYTGVVKGILHDGQTKKS